MRLAVSPDAACKKERVRNAVPEEASRVDCAMKVHEYQAKELLKKAGVAVPDGIVVTTARRSRQGLQSAGRRVDRGQGPGSRGRARQRELQSGRTTTGRSALEIASGRKPRPETMAKGVQLVKSAEEAQRAAASLLGKTLVTYQTGPQGQPDLESAGHRRARYRPRALPGHGDRPRPSVPGADGLDRRGRRDRDRRTQEPREDPASSDRRRASAWPISRRGRSARRWT